MHHNKMLQFVRILHQPENPKQKNLIMIPYNLWEEFGVKGNIKGELKINDTNFEEVNLIPRGNGSYGFIMTNKMQKAIGADYGEELYISVTKKSEPKREEEPSKNQVKNYYKIENVMLKMQTNFAACGQACIAMLTNRDVATVCNELKMTRAMSIGQIIEGLDNYYIHHAEKNVRLSQKNPTIPEIAILTVHMETYTHWVLFFKGRYLDPEFGEFTEEYTKGKITSFLTIFEE